MTQEPVTVSVQLSKEQANALTALAEQEGTNISQLLVRGGDAMLAMYSGTQTSIIERDVVPMLVLLLKFAAQILFYCNLRLKLGPLENMSMPQNGRKTIWAES